MSKIMTKNIYNKFGKDYHQQEKDPGKTFSKRFIVNPAMTFLIKDIVKNKKVLDLACGAGVFTRKLSSWGAKVVGLDISKTLIEIARNENSAIQFYIADAIKTPFKNSQFDIISSSLLVHYIKNIKLLFNEVSRMLKKRGLFIFSIRHPMTEVLKKIEINDKREYVLIPYFHNKKYTWNMLKRFETISYKCDLKKIMNSAVEDGIKGMEMVNYHHTFGNIINCLNDSGFVIERLLEPKPSKRSEKYNKKDYSRTSKYPSFCVIKARKI
ncbi:class I SAM-dependent methyltransferase [bacterium]|nr:class I SAM-dependent methyltransferase [bacterium]